jgi:hypothetical protein
MRRIIPITVAFVIRFVANGLDFKDGPFDGKPFHPSAPITWNVTSTLPRSLIVYRPMTEKVSHIVVSNAMYIGSFKSINLIRSKDKSIIEFRDTRKVEDSTRFVKLSATAGWVKYNDNCAQTKPVHGVPSFAEAEKRALEYFLLLGGNTNQLSPKPWPHNEGTFETYDKPGGRLISKGVDSREVSLFRQIDGIPVLGNSFSVEFGNDAKPIMLDMNWPPFEPVKQYEIATRNEILEFLKSGRAFYPVWPEQPEVSSAKAFTVRSIQYLYQRGFGANPQELLRPYVSLGMEADVGGKIIKFGLKCPIIADEKVR